MLETFLVSQVFAFFLIFCRIGSAVMILPGFGEAYVPPSVRLTFSFILSLLLTPFLAKQIPALPAAPLAFFLLTGSEIMTGLFIGTICKILISATHTAGMIFSFQSGMSSAVIFDVTQAAEGSLVGNFIGLLALVLLFTLDMHHFILHAITDSYTVFTPGKWPPLRDFTETAVRTLGDTFIISTQIATPLIVIGTLLFLGAGVLSRLMPTIQVFFLIIPPQLLICFFILSTTFSAVMLWYMEFYREKLMMIFSYVR